jgi:hypothetical protein
MMKSSTYGLIGAVSWGVMMAIIIPDVDLMSLIKKAVCIVLGITAIHFLARSAVTHGNAREKVQNNSSPEESGGG